MDIRFIFITTVSTLYAFSELFMGIRQSRYSKVKIRGDKGSIWFMLLFISVAYFLTFGFFGTGIGRLNHRTIFFIIGVITSALGLVIRIKSILTLKQHFTYTVARTENHTLIETGLYKFIRHPGYLGQLIFFCGISLSLSNWISVVCMTVATTLGYSYRIIVEEKFLLKQFGEEYKEYQKRTWRLLPGIF
jgi:protein-S-isoprenylcysteine O-methyltransferase Ste14